MWHIKKLGANLLFLLELTHKLHSVCTHHLLGAVVSSAVGLLQSQTFYKSCPPSLLSSGTRGSCPGSKAAGTWSWSITSI